MEVTAVIALVNQAVYAQTNRHLSDLQQATIAKVWEGKKYHEIADEYGCTEGHAKDTGSLLWKLLSKAWGKKVTKSNFRSLSKLQLESANKLNLFSEVIEQEGVAGAARKSFLGRKNAIATLQNLISQGCKVIVLQGEGGIGKTTLAQNFLEIQDFELTLEVLMAKETENIISVASVIEEWLQRDLGEDSGKEFGVTLARLKRYLEHHRVGILIDNLEPALDKDGKLVQEHRSYIELLRILADPKVKSTTIITSRDRFCEAEIDLEHYRLTGLDLAAWRQYFAACQIEGKARAVVKIHRIYGGNAKAMGIVCGILREDYEGDADRYWKENCHDPLAEADLKNLVVSQLDRLQNLDERAYLLLCRLGCYRYQDLTQIPQAGLFCLLWDVPRPRYRQVIKSLRNRSLLEFSQGKYWLHPMVRGEARARLYRSPQEWQKTHHQIADFITNSVDKINSIQDALIALEAYYHYIETSDYDLAAKVILHGRENQWGQFLTLGTTMYRLGIIQPLLTAIEGIIEKVEHPRYRSELNNILGDLYWTTGKVYRAISCQQKAIAISQNCLQSISATPDSEHELYYWRMLEVDSLLSWGLYNIDLWELAAAADLFKQVIDLASHTKHHSWSEKASLGLALVRSHLIGFDSSNAIVEHLYHQIIELENEAYNTGRFAYFMQILGQILFNYQRIASAKAVWQKTILFSQEGNFTQIKAKSLTGLGNVERHRNNLEEAEYYHHQAIESLEKIDAKCDLAEAYFQLGITLKQKKQANKSIYFLRRAVKLFRQIEAPKQVERVETVLNEMIASS